MIYVTCNTKGGVGKSLTSINLACLLHARGRNFKVVELDNSNTSIIFNNSYFLTKERAISLKLEQKDTAINDMLFDLMCDNSLDYIIDLGGGDDTKVLDALKVIELPKTYIIPTLKIKKYLQNAINTYQYINDPKNTVFVLNQYGDIQKIQSEFKWFFGCKERGIRPVSTIFKTTKTIYMPYSELFEIAEEDEQTIIDLASDSHGVTEAQAREMSFKLADGDRIKFGALLTQYHNSLDAQKLFEEIQESTRALFE